MVFPKEVFSKEVFSKEVFSKEVFFKEGAESDFNHIDVVSIYQTWM